MSKNARRGIAFAFGWALLFIVIPLQAQNRPLWAPKAPEKPEVPPMPVTEKPEPEFNMERPLFDRPAAEQAEIEGPVSAPLPDEVLAERPEDEDAPVPVEDEAEDEPVMAREVGAGDSRAVELNDGPADTPAKPAVAAPEPATEQALAMNVPAEPAARAAGSGEAARRLRVLSRGRLPQLPSAFHNGTEGWVRLEFELDASGKPVNIHVLESRPRRVFNRVAMKYLRTWRYDTAGLTEKELRQRRKVKVEFRH